MSAFKLMLGSAACAGALALTAGAAHADVVCNRWGECWRVPDRTAHYPRALGVRFYNDDWWTRHQHNRRYHWREVREGEHGYWRHNHWTVFP